MNDAVRDVLERRQCYRAPLSASARVRSPARRAACVRRVDDLSLGGAHLVGRAPAAVGETVTIAIQIDGRHRIAPHGRIARVTGGGSGFAIEFTVISPRAEELIHGCLVRALEADGVPAVLLIEPERGARRDLARVLAQVGYRVIAVATPVEAIDQLTAHARRICAALVSQRLTQTTGVEFVGFLKDAFPHIRRVMTAGAGSAPQPAGPRAPGLVHGAVTAPWLREEVSRAIGTRRAEHAS